MLKITASQGFTITFENGYTASVQFGDGNYCENRNGFGNYNSVQSSNAEVAHWKGLGSIQDVRGWQSPKEVLEYLNMVAELQ
jgi:hypothetical protein